MYNEEVTDPEIFDTLDIVYRNPKIISSKLIPCHTQFDGSFSENHATEWQKSHCSEGSHIREIRIHESASNIWVAPRRSLTSHHQAFANNTWVEVHRKTMSGAHGFHEGGNKMADGRIQPYGCWFHVMKGTGVFLNIGKTMVMDRKKLHRDSSSKEWCADSKCPDALANGYDSVQYISGWHGMHELVMCSGQCATEPLLSTCPPVELRTGLKADKQCTCMENLQILNCGDQRIPDDTSTDLCGADFSCGQ